MPHAIPLSWRIRKDPSADHRPGLAISPITHRQQQTAAAQRPLHRRGRHDVPIGAHQRGDLAMPPRRPGFGILRRHRLHAVDDGRRPRTFHRLALAQAGQLAVVAAPRDTRQAGEPRNRQTSRRSQGLEVFEGTASAYSAPFCQIRSCTVASASASLSWLFSSFNRRSSAEPALLPGPGILSANDSCLASRSWHSLILGSLAAESFERDRRR
jgi:hypothetical protein